MNLRQSLNTTEMFRGLRDSLGRARLSPIEIIALVLALTFAGAVAFYYFTKVQPLDSKLAELQARELEMRQRLEKFNSDEKKRQEQATNADAILVSLKSFDGYLKPDERGMTEIINEIDQLGGKYGVITGDSTYRVDEAEPLYDENGQPIQKQNKNEDKQKIYPALGIDTNVIGEYPNLRRFLADLERSRQFLIINALVFQGESDQVKRASQKSGRQKLQLSSAEAVPVSLKIEMDTYFQSPYKKELSYPADPASEKKVKKAGE